MVIALHDTVINLSNICSIEPRAHKDTPYDRYVQMFDVNGSFGQTRYIIHRGDFYKTPEEAVQAAKNALHLACFEQKI